VELGPEDAALRAEMVDVLEHASLDPHGELAPDEQALRPSPSLERRR
jgi:hypothetical protein